MAKQGTYAHCMSNYGKWSSFDKLSILKPLLYIGLNINITFVQIVQTLVSGVKIFINC